MAGEPLGLPRIPSATVEARLTLSTFLRQSDVHYAGGLVGRANPGSSARAATP